MPFINVKVAGKALSDQQVAALQDGITDLMSGVLGKKAELTSVLVEQGRDFAWSVGKSSVGCAAHIDARITAGTNSVEEKASFVERAYALLEEVLGSGLPIATYVVLSEVHAGDWGYAGLTQAHRARVRELAA